MAKLEAMKEAFWNGGAEWLENAMLLIIEVRKLFGLLTEGEERKEDIYKELEREVRMTKARGLDPRIHPDKIPLYFLAKLLKEHFEKAGKLEGGILTEIDKMTSSECAIPISGARVIRQRWLYRKAILKKREKEEQSERIAASIERLGELQKAMEKSLEEVKSLLAKLSGVLEEKARPVGSWETGLLPPLTELHIKISPQGTEVSEKFSEAKGQ